MSKPKKRTQESVDPTESENTSEQSELENDVVFEDESAEQDRLTPSWFASTYKTNTPDELVKRYREHMEAEPRMPVPPPEAYELYRRRIEERFQAGKRLAEQQYAAANRGFAGHQPPPLRRPVLRHVSDDGLRRFQIWDEQVAARRGIHPIKTDAQDKPRLGRKRLVAGIVIACIAGSALGYFTATGTNPSQTLANLSADASGLVQKVWSEPQTVVVSTDRSLGDTKVDQASTSAEPGETVLSKKPVKVPRVTVSDASGVLNNPIPLEMATYPASPDEPLALKVSGLPDNAYLTQGKEIAKGEWLIKSNEIAGVKLIIPTSTQDQVDLSVAPVEEKTLEPAAPAQELTVALDMKNLNVLPANAPPEGAQVKEEALPQPIPLPLEVTNNAAANFMTKGEALLKTGDIHSARQFLTKAFEAGEPKAAFGIGQSYDPLFYKTMKVTGLLPDKSKAVEWYTKAAQSGHVEASEALARLSETAEQ